MTMDIDKSELREIPFFAALPERDLENVLRRSRKVSFEPGQAVVEKGESRATMYVLLSGTARVEVGGRYHDLRRGSLLGEMSALSGKPRIATVQAVEPMSAVEIDCDDIGGLFAESPALAVQMLKILVERLREVENRIDAWMGVYVP